MDGKKTVKQGRKSKDSEVVLVCFKTSLSVKPICLISTLTKIETGVIKEPSVYAVAKIAEALGGSLDNLAK